MAVCRGRSLTTSADIDGLYVWDGLGNPVGLLVDFAANVFSYSYDPYGTQVLTAGGTENGSAQNPYSFKAGIQDRASGLVKFGIRWYNPTTGTWTQQDTLDTPLDPHNANRYAYAANDPINNIDPTGMVLGLACGAGVVFGAGLIVAGFSELGLDAFAAVASAPTVAGPIAAGALAGTIAGQIAFGVFVAGVSVNECLA